MDPGQEVAAAIRAVLRLQEHSHLALEAARQEAEALILAARESARHIEERTDRRISRLHKEQADRLQKVSNALLRKEKMKGERAREEGLRAEVDLPALARRLAERLTAAPEDPPALDDPPGGRR